MTLDDWAGLAGIACELLGCHDQMFVLALPNVPGYIILNATTGVVSQATYPALVRDFGLDCEVKSLVNHLAVTPC